MRLVAGGGFVPQAPIDSAELIDSTMVRNAKNGYKGKFFIQFSFSLPGSWSELSSFLEHACFALAR
jgi:hypothetical protein